MMHGQSPTSYVNLILNALTDELYDYYNTTFISKNCRMHCNRNTTEEVKSKKYEASRYLWYQMTDDRSMEAQSYELQKIANEIINEGMSLN